MFIQTEDTPNPNALKFIPGTPVLNEGTLEFKNKEDARLSPLATRLFEIEGVKSIFLGSNFISVTKQADYEWFLLKPSLFGAIMEHFLSEKPILLKEVEQDISASAATEEEDIVIQIKELLETRVRPAVAMDGGDIVFEKFENGVVYVRLKGACSGCPSSTATLKAGIENMLRYYVPGVEEVRAVEDE